MFIQVSIKTKAAFKPKVPVHMENVRVTFAQATKPADSLWVEAGGRALKVDSWSEANLGWETRAGEPCLWCTQSEKNVLYLSRWQKSVAVVSSIQGKENMEYHCTFTNHGAPPSWNLWATHCPQLDTRLRARGLDWLHQKVPYENSSGLHLNEYIPPLIHLSNIYICNTMGFEAFWA